MAQDPGLFAEKLRESNTDQAILNLAAMLNAATLARLFNDDPLSTVKGCILEQVAFFAARGEGFSKSSLEPLIKLSPQPALQQLFEADLVVSDTELLRAGPRLTSFLGRAFLSSPDIFPIISAAREALGRLAEKAVRASAKTWSSGSTSRGSEFASQGGGGALG